MSKPDKCGLKAERSDFNSRPNWSAIFWPFAVTDCYTLSLDIARGACYNEALARRNSVTTVTNGADFTRKIVRVSIGVFTYIFVCALWHTVFVGCDGWRKESPYD